MKGNEDLQGILGDKGLRRERISTGNLSEEKGEDFRGGKALGGKGGLGFRGSQQGKKQKILGRKREKISEEGGGKAFGKDLNRKRGGKMLGRKGRRSGAKRPYGGKGGKDPNRERGEKILGRKREKI